MSHKAAQGDSDPEGGFWAIGMVDSARVPARLLRAETGRDRALLLLVGVVFVLPPLVEWAVNGRNDYALIAGAGLLGLGAALVRTRRRQRERS